MKLPFFILLTLFGASVHSNEDCPTGCEECFCTEDVNGYLEIDCEDYKEETFPQCITQKVRSVSITRSEITRLSSQDFVNATSLEVLRISESPLLTSIDDGTFEELTSLQELSITKCGLASLSDVLSRSFVNLTELSLEHNAIEVIPASFFDGLTSLQTLDLSYNNITSIENRFRETQNLTSLDLSYNCLESIRLNSLTGLTSLVTLMLSNNRLSAMAEGCLHGTSIDGLYLDHNQLDFLPEGLFDNIPTLHILNLEANGFMELPVSTLRKATSLTHLWFSQNPIQAINANSFDNLINLEALHLQNMDYLTTVEDGALAGLNNLMELNVNYCPVLRNFSAAALVPEDKENLIVLFLNNNTIRNFNEDVFKNLPMLRIASITGNPIICSCDVLWMKIYMDAGEPEWVLPWSEGMEAVICEEPANMQGNTLMSIPLEELTCEKPELHSKNTLIAEKYALFEVMLSRGLPSTYWKAPDGRLILPVTGRTLTPLATINPGPYIAAEEVLSNFSVLATLIIQPLSDSSFGTFNLTATNAGGVLEESFDLVAPTEAPSHQLSAGEIAGIVLTTIILLAAAIGVAYIYMAQRKSQPYQRFERSNLAATETAEGPILGGEMDEEEGRSNDEAAGISNQGKSYGATESSNPFEETEHQPKIV